MFRSTARRSPKKNSAQRFYSMSSQIQEEHKAYYEILETTQKGGMDVTKWLVWFLDCLGRPIAKAKTLTAAVLEKDAFWRHLKKKSIEVSERQKTIINLLLDGIGGKLTTESVENSQRLPTIRPCGIFRISSKNGFRNRTRLVGGAQPTLAPRTRCVNWVCEAISRELFMLPSRLVGWLDSGGSARSGLK